MGIESSFNFRRVSDRVTTSGLVTAEDLTELKAGRYELVVNLLPDSSEHAVDGEAASVRNQGVGYVYIPVDFDAPTHEQFEEFAAVMDANADRRIHIHCAANYRVSAFYSFYAMRRGWWNAEEADEHVRSIWAPSDHPVWDDFIAAERERIAGNRRLRHEHSKWSAAGHGVSDLARPHDTPHRLVRPERCSVRTRPVHEARVILPAVVAT